MTKVEKSHPKNKFVVIGCLLVSLLLGGSFVVGVGVGVGWFALGWWLYPVVWVDAAPPDLSPSYQDIYINLIIDSYLLNQDMELVKSRLAPWADDEIIQLLDRAVAIAAEQGQVERVDIIQAIRGIYTDSPIELHEP